MCVRAGTWISFAGMVCMPTIEAMPPGAWSGSGPSGLLGHVNRSFSLGLEDLGRNLTLTEEQAVGRILAPAVVASNENTAPSIDASESGIREGLVVNEFGSLAHLEVMVVDAESNVERVEADLTGLGIGIDPLSLSDRARWATSASSMMSGPWPSRSPQRSMGPSSSQSRRRGCIRGGLSVEPDHPSRQSTPTLGLL